jgi:hypothetical protein
MSPDGDRLSGNHNTPEGGLYFVLYVFVLYFVFHLYFFGAGHR